MKKEVKAIKSSPVIQAFQLTDLFVGKVGMRKGNTSGIHQLGCATENT
jgi:hypothetical protein